MRHKIYLKDLFLFILKGFSYFVFFFVFSQYVNTGTCYQQSYTDRRECSKDNNDEYESL
jgi:hypothetical protein